MNLTCHAQKKELKMAETVQGIIDALPEHFNPNAASGMDAVFQFDISGDQGGQWYVAIKNQSCEIAAGTHPTPTVSYGIGGNDFIEMMSGRLSGQAAFFSGKLRVSGDLMMAQRLEGLFRK